MSSHPDSFQVLPENYYEPLEPASLFGRQAPLHVDVGCGDGGFLLQQAQTNPGLNFLGIERLFGRVRRICRAAYRGEVFNLRVLRLESTYAVRYLLPANSVQRMYILFPDPWPKAKHHERRLLKQEFLQSTWQALQPGGLVVIKTDHPGYACDIEELLDSSSDWVRERGEEDYCGGIRTDFETEFISAGREIFCHVLRKPGKDGGGDNQVI